MPTGLRAVKHDAPVAKPAWSVHGKHAVLVVPTGADYGVYPARSEDLLGLAQIRQESWRTAYRGLLPESGLRRMNMHHAAERMARALHSPVQQLLVIRAPAGDPMGYAWLGPHPEGYDGHRGEIYELYLHPRHQGQGAGRCLLFASIWELIARELNPPLVWVLSANPARHFYEACGGEPLVEGWVRVFGRSFRRIAFSWRDALPLPYQTR